MKRSICIWICLTSMTALCISPKIYADEPVNFTPYGFINPTVIVTYGEPETFGRANAGAVTAAANPVLDTNDDQVTKTLQVAQSRIGLKIDSPYHVKGVFEIDFIDFQKSTPTLAMQPRLRVASVTKQFGDHHKIVAGQLWDLHAYVQPFHTNFVGANFQAGNSAFMRLQLQYLYETPSVEVGAALGMPAANIGPALSELERDAWPTLAGRAQLKLGADGKGRVGASAIVGRLKVSDDAWLTSWAAALMLDAELGSRVSLRAESYMAQNGANLSLLSLSQGRANADLRELGGYTSAKFTLSPAHKLTLTAGVATLLNEEDALPAYAYPAPDAPASARPAQGPGIARNAHIRVGYIWTLVPRLDLAVEPMWLQTRHLLDAADSDVEATRQVFGLQTSMIYTF